MAKDLTSIQSNPVEGGVRELVDVIPAELLSEESAHACLSAELR